MITRLLKWALRRRDEENTKAVARTGDAAMKAWGRAFAFSEVVAEIQKSSTAIELHGDLAELDERQLRVRVEALRDLYVGELERNKKLEPKIEELQSKLEARNQDVAQMCTGDIRPVPTSAQVVNHRLEVENARLQDELDQSTGAWAALLERCERETDPYRDAPSLVERDEEIVRGFIRKIKKASQVEVERVTAGFDCYREDEVTFTGPIKMEIDKGDELLLVRRRKPCKLCGGTKRAPSGVEFNDRQLYRNCPECGDDQAEESESPPARIRCTCGRVIIPPRPKDGEDRSTFDCPKCEKRIVLFSRFWEQAVNGTVYDIKPRIDVGRPPV